MVIAGIVIYVYPDITPQISQLCEIYKADNQKFIGVVEGETIGEIEKKVDSIRKIYNVINVSYAYVNYEVIK